MTPEAELRRPGKTGGAAVAINRYMPYIPGMDDFLRGMSSIGQLFPNPASYSGYPPQDSAWRGVANSFYQTGNNIRTAMKEAADVQRKSKQTP
jgi:hypothetical protein